jgi:hypothetical protein
MAAVTVTLSVRAKWWMRPALWLAYFALAFRLIRDAKSTEQFGGLITADERVAKWLTDYAFIIEARSPDGR